MNAGRLVLVRHAKSDYPWGVSDHDRPLNPRGTRDAPEVGRWLDEHLAWAPGVVPAVRVSTARRAQLTWLGARSCLSERWVGADVVDEARIYEADVATLIDVAVEAAPAGLVVIVGHNPGLADLVEHLAVADALRAQALVKFPTASIAVLEVRGGTALAEAVTTPGSMRVSDFAVPRG